jgi:hypothetical protein
MLAAMKSAVDASEASRRNYAYLFDRVQVLEGKQQRWGTQSQCEKGRATLYPVDDVAHLEERRSEAGLEPLADSLKGSDATCARLRR